MLKKELIITSAIVKRKNRDLVYYYVFTTNSNCRLTHSVERINNCDWTRVTRCVYYTF